MAQQFFDHFALANLSLQERLGRSAATLNKDSAVFGQQTRSFLQMLTYGLDAITARAATHLLNMDVLYSNDSYLLKLAEGVLLNSIESITPPKINDATPFRFWSERSYTRWSSLGTIALKDGTKTNLVVFKINEQVTLKAPTKGRNMKPCIVRATMFNRPLIRDLTVTPRAFLPLSTSVKPTSLCGRNPLKSSWKWTMTNRLSIWIWLGRLMNS